MSEEILKALTQLFAIISKQDGGVTEGERNFVIKYFKQELDTNTVKEYIALYDKASDYGVEELVPVGDEDGGKKRAKKRLTNVKDSVRTLGICRKINKTLNQKQKVIVLSKLLELLAADRSFTPQRMEIINTVSTVFNVPTDEYKLIESFVIEEHSSKLNHEDILIFDDEMPPEGSKIKFIDSGLLDGEIIFVRVKSVGLYFTKYTGIDEIYLNSMPVKKGSILQFSPGSVFKTPKGAPLYYSDLVSRYNSDKEADKISFNVYGLEFKFPNGDIGLRNVDISENTGKLIGIMGASGAGKTTLLNTLAGLESPSKGEVLINGFNIYKEKDKIEGIIGYVAQDDLLIEDLTVYQNLFYNAKLCFKGSSKEELDKRVMEVLESLGLDRIKDLKVGNVLNKKISGGQRKRLNIALELIREPAVLFVDEPTSGLSSRDSENVIDLLKELSLKGKLIFVVIHQPSSDIFKMFDKMFLMDTGGYPIFYGNPVEAVVYFKKASGQVDSEHGQCHTCGNVNPEQIFNIIEARVVDEYGEFTNRRKVKPTEWHKCFQEEHVLERKEDIREKPPKTLKIPTKINQTVIFAIRDFLSKISNTQYLAINLIEAPLLALILALIIRYKGSHDMDYIYRHNDNIPAYILICIIVSLFMGLSVSAEEIIRDRKILKREKFLNLSRSSYLISKLIILFTLSGIQTLSFVLIGNTILEIEGVNLVYWFVLFTVSCHANVLGLNISSAFNSAVTVYILIPLLIIPQLVLSGVIFDFDKLNNVISKRGMVPLIADGMASRWSYEALAVEQFKGNKYQKGIFEYEKQESINNFKSAYWIPKMQELITGTNSLLEEKNDSTKKLAATNLQILKSEFLQDPYTLKFAEGNIEDFKNISIESYDESVSSKLWYHLEDSKGFYSLNLVNAGEAKDSILYAMQQELKEGENLKELIDRYSNDQLTSLMKNSSAEERIDVESGEIIQIVDPVYQMPKISENPLNYRAQFLASEKPFFGKYIDTYVFNLAVIWLMTFMLYLALYYDVLSKLLRQFGNISSRRLKRK
ncbi:MAG: ATP-binding cassette domain-containing protein [Flammeovirgaceae bacterium]|nr:ATP-binding cassette domain-containing protein [Flammeovirgaceae bacterium]